MKPCPSLARILQSWQWLSESVLTVMVLPWQHNMLSLITQKSLINKSLAMPGIWQWFLLRPFEFQSLGTAVGSPGGGQSKQKQAHPAVTESIWQWHPTPPQQGFHGHMLGMLSKTTMSSRPGPNHLKIASTVSIASSRWDRHLLETSCILPGELLPLPAILPAQDLVPWCNLRYLPL